MTFRDFQMKSPTMRNQAGFTLIEMLIVVALILGITAMFYPSVSSINRVSLHSAVRQFAGTIKDAYNATLLTGRVHRVAYDLKKSAFWVEIGPATLLLDTKESREKEALRKKFASKESQEKAPPPPSFEMDKRVTRKEISLPRGVVFEDVVTEQRREPFTEGTAYTHIFPSGVTEKTIIHIKDPGDRKMSIVIEPLVGHVRMLDGYVEEEEAFGK